MSLATSADPSFSNLEFPAVPEYRVFAISADADPGTLPRILELFAKRGLVPDRINAERRGDGLAIEIAVTDMDAELAAYIGRCLREIYVVRGTIVGCA